MRSHHFAARGYLEPLGSRFVCFDLWHAIYSILNFQ